LNLGRFRVMGEVSMEIRPIKLFYGVRLTRLNRIYLCRTNNKGEFCYRFKIHGLHFFWGNVSVYEGRRKMRLFMDYDLGAPGFDLVLER
jgi:hypothetical protein